MSLKITIKEFEMFSLKELYDVLQLRSQVFVVEQDCVYQDIDGKDGQALHILGKHKGKIVAYTRCFAPGIYFKEASIGRVVVAETYRNEGYGIKIMEASIQAIQIHYRTHKIKLSAQTYLTKFYNSLGFFESGEGYLEDGIPHIAMVRGN